MRLASSNENDGRAYHCLEIKKLLPGALLFFNLKCCCCDNCLYLLLFHFPARTRTWNEIRQGYMPMNLARLDCHEEWSVRILDNFDETLTSNEQRSCPVLGVRFMVLIEHKDFCFRIDDSLALFGDYRNFLIARDDCPSLRSAFGDPIFVEHVIRPTLIVVPPNLHTHSL